MEGFEVTVEALRDAAEAGRPVAGDVAALPVAEAVAAVGAALPGGAADDAARASAAAWRARVATTAEALAQQSAALVVAADCYEAAERGAVVELAGEP
jgi:hypothetical protein